MMVAAQSSGRRRMLPSDRVSLDYFELDCGATAIRPDTPSGCFGE